MPTRNDIQGEINACKSLLGDTDYSVLKTLEGLLTCETVQDIIEYIASVSDSVREKVKKRVKWRETINQCEDELESIEENTEGDE